MKNYMALLEFLKNQVCARFLNASKVGATTTSSGNEFQVGTTRDEKKYLVLLHLATGTANLNLCPLWVENIWKFEELIKIKIN